MKIFKTYFGCIWSCVGKKEIKWISKFGEKEKGNLVSLPNLWPNLADKRTSRTVSLIGGAHMSVSLLPFTCSSSPLSFLASTSMPHRAATCSWTTCREIALPVGQSSLSFSLRSLSFFPCSPSFRVNTIVSPWSKRSGGINPHQFPSFPSPLLVYKYSPEPRHQFCASMSALILSCTLPMSRHGCAPPEPPLSPRGR